jgi:hypothetical protein
LTWLAQLFFKILKNVLDLSFFYPSTMSHLINNQKKIIVFFQLSKKKEKKHQQPKTTSHKKIKIKN